MFNLSGSEIVFLLLIALIVLGPEKLPDAVRKFGRMYAEFKKMSTGFQTELKSALDEPMREMRETAEAIKKAADFEFNADVDGVVGSDVEIEPEETPKAVEPTTDTPITEETEAPSAEPPKAGHPPVVETLSPETYDEPSYGSNIIDAVDESRTE